MKVTAHVLRAVYTLLLDLPPFNRWGLPKPQEVTFSLLKADVDHAELEIGGRGKPRISVNPDTHTTLLQVIESVAHEMAHIRQRNTAKTELGWLSHNKSFQKIARQICHSLGLDAQRF